MNPLQIQQVIQEMARRIVERFHPEKIILFGSHARGTAGPDSDVDLLVVLPSDGSRRKKVVEIYTLLAGMGMPKDVFVVTPEDIEKYRNIPGNIIGPALSEGKVLYERAA
ncbi:MAG: nucleotidyltransferase domain-containing protein [Gammaproteobacteria bacterium]